jgi:hypothetical protein
MVVHIIDGIVLSLMINCGNTNDTWMDFKPLVSIHGAMKSTTECVCELGDKLTIEKGGYFDYYI